MIALTSAFPRKPSRTSTQAVIVPSTAFSSATTTEAPSVSFRAETASGLEIAAQKPCDPAFLDSQTRAANGRTTMSVRKVVTMPRDRAVPALSLRSRPLGTRTARGGATIASLASDPADLPFDPGENTRALVEELRLYLAPTTEPDLVDREQAGSDGEPLRVRPKDALHHGPVAVVGEDLLRARRPEKAEELVCLLLVRASLEDGDGVLDHDGGVRDDVLDRRAFELRRNCFALVGDERIALPRD